MQRKMNKKYEFIMTMRVRKYINNKNKVSKIMYKIIIMLTLYDSSSFKQFYIIEKKDL